MNKCIFLDRDGVINKERGEYTFKIDDFTIEEGIIELLNELKKNNYLLIIVTNQGGINKKLYSKEDVFNCHDYFQEKSRNIIDDLFYSPYHDNFTKSLARKPNSLMLEKAIYKWDVDVRCSWMIGDSDRDIIAGTKMDLKSLYVGKNINKQAEQSFESSAAALKYILNSKS